MSLKDLLNIAPPSPTGRLSSSYARTRNTPGYTPGMLTRYEEEKKELERLNRQPQSVIGKVVDTLNRPLYGSRVFADVLFSEDHRSIATIGKALKEGWKEFVDPDDRLTTEDLFKRYAPGWSKKNPDSAFWLGLAGDIVLDPLNALTLGSGTLFSSGVKVTAKGDKIVTLSKTGEKLKGSLINTAKKQGAVNKEGAVVVPQRAIKVLNKNIETALDMKLGDVLDTSTSAAYRSLGESLLEIGAGKKVEGGVELVKAVKDPGGVKLFGKSVIGGEGAAVNFGRFANALGLNSTNETWQLFKKRLVDNSFTRAFALDTVVQKRFPELAKFSHTYEARTAEIGHTVGQVYKSVFGDLKTESREKIQSFIRETRPALAQIEGYTSDYLGALTGGQLTNPKRAKFNLMAAALKQAAKEYDFTDKERMAVTGLLRVANEIFDYDLGLKSATHLLDIIDPNVYEVIKSPGVFGRFKDWLTGRRMPGSTELKKFKSAAEAAQQGHQPVADAGKLFLARYFEYQHSQQSQFLRNFLETTYGERNIGDIPEKAVQAQVFRIGGAADITFYEDTNPLIAVMDFYSRQFRRSATIVKAPAFAIKQTVGNGTQWLLEEGLGSFTWKSPEAVVLSMKAVMNNGKFTDGITDAFGFYHSPESLTEMFKTHPIFKNRAIEDVGRVFESRTQQEVTRELLSKPDLKGGTPSARKGLTKLFKAGLAPLDFPAVLEDWFRGSAFINSVMNGNSVEAAMKTVDDAFFNYTTGLTRVEQNIRRTLVPFYTYTKFGSALLLKATGKRPANTQIAAEFGKGISEVWNKLTGDEELNPSERFILGDTFLFEQPSVYEGMTPDGKAKFRRFSNMFVLDALNFMEFDKSGELEPEQTFVKTILGQMMPWIKKPVEWYANRGLFVETPQFGPFRNNIGDVDSERLLSNLMMAAGLHGGATGGILGKALGEGFARSDTIENVFKKIIGWEEAVGPDGRRRVYLNGYSLVALSEILPGMRQAITMSKNDASFLDDSLYFTFGIGQSQLDIQQRKLNKYKHFDRRTSDLTSELRKVLRQERESTGQKLLGDLQQYIEESRKDFELFEVFPTRGPVSYLE